MPTTQCLIPGLLTHVELDPLLGSSRTRQRWEHSGVLPKGRWVKGFGRRMGLYPEVVLARVVAGPGAGKSEAALGLLASRSAELLESELFGEIENALHGIFRELEHIGLRPEVLECLAGKQLLHPLQVEMCKLADEVVDAGIVFEGTVGTLTKKTGGIVMVESDDATLKLAAESVLGFIEEGCTVALERVRVGPKEHDFVVPALPTQAHRVPALQSVGDDEAQWEEMFASFNSRPIAIPVIVEDSEPGAGGDLVRQARAVKIRIPAELYAGANPMVRTNLETAHA
jgi:hypothetical protein